MSGTLRASPEFDRKGQSPRDTWIFAAAHPRSLISQRAQRSDTFILHWLLHFSNSLYARKRYA